jgi:hypothetical protein
MGAVVADVAATLNAAAKILCDDHLDHDEQPRAEGPGIGTDDVEQLPHARILRRQEQTERKVAGLKLGICGSERGRPIRPSTHS